MGKSLASAAELSSAKSYIGLFRRRFQAAICFVGAGFDVDLCVAHLDQTLGTRTLFASETRSSARNASHLRPGVVDIDSRVRLVDCQSLAARYSLSPGVFI